MTWRCTHCGEIYEDNEVCPEFEEEKAERYEEIEAENTRLKAAIRAHRDASQAAQKDEDWDDADEALWATLEG